MRKANEKDEKNLFLPVGELEDVEAKEVKAASGDVLVLVLRDMWLDDGRVSAGQKVTVSDVIAQLGSDAGFCRRV